MQKSIFITFEGGEGCGKSTQSKLLFEAVKKSNLQGVLTREPGGVESAEIIRNLLLDKSMPKWELESEVLLHMTARLEHIRKLIKPALELNKIVICDRFIDSTSVYQGYGFGVDIEFITKLHNIITKSFYPDLTLIFDMDVELAQARVEKRQAVKDRYESLDIDFHNRIRNGFLDIAKNNPDRCIIINASESIENLHFQIIKLINFKLGLNLTT